MDKEVSICLLQTMDSRSKTEMLMNWVWLVEEEGGKECGGGGGGGVAPYENALPV